MTLINKLLLMGLMCIFIGLPSAYGEDQKSSQKHDWQGKRDQIFAQLNLTEEQKVQLKTNKEQQRARMKESFERIRSQREAMKQELMKPQLDMKKINAIQAQLKKGMSQMADNRLNTILEVRKILTPEQFSKFLNVMNEGHKKFEGKGHFADD